jgi:hypothetical protein
MGRNHYPAPNPDHLDCVGVHPRDLLALRNLRGTRMKMIYRQAIRFGIFALLFAGCLWISPSGCSLAGNEKWLAQAFGDYIRSVEGRANIEKVPALIIAGRDKWLPKGEKWDAFAAGIIREYIKANPQNDAEMNKVLEQIAMQLNTKR